MRQKEQQRLATLMREDYDAWKTERKANVHELSLFLVKKGHMKEGMALDCAGKLVDRGYTLGELREQNPNYIATYLLANAIDHITSIRAMLLIKGALENAERRIKH